jgi:hypothetical protein
MTAISNDQWSFVQNKDKTWPNLKRLRGRDNILGFIALAS